jgi:tetratricopeptide (TPR) repeat protein
VLLLGLIGDDPRDVAAWHALGQASYLIRDDATMLRAWSRVWELDPDHWDSADMAFALGVVHAKRGDHAASVRVYRKGMAATPDLDLRGLLASNCAESTMALGDVAGALRLYETSARLRPRQNSAAYWGMMVAQDRLRRALAAEQAAQVALALDPTLRGLTGPDVFFVPTGDVHYYLALAHEHQGRVTEAVAEWRRFLAALPASPHAARVAEHLLRLRGAVAALRPRASLRWVDPFHLRLAVAPLTAEVQRCYATRRRGPAGVPEGRLRLHLTLRRDRVVGVTTPAGDGVMAPDADLGRCLRARLKNRRIATYGRATIEAEFLLELIP